MQIALPVWRGRISPLLDTAGHLLVVEMDGRHETARRQEALSGRILQERAAVISGLGCDWVICGAVSREMAIMLAALDVRLLPWVAGEVDEIITAFAEGRLTGGRFMMPGFRLRGRRRGRRRAGRWPYAP